MNLNAAASQLADMIAGMPDFIEMRNLRYQINQDNKLNTLISQFESKQQMLYSSQITQSKGQQLMSELESDYNTLMTFPLLNKYFSYQESVNQIVGDFMETLNAELDRRM